MPNLRNVDLFKTARSKSELSPMLNSFKFNFCEASLNNFYNYCSKELSLNIIGLMCLPPINSNSEEYFKILKNTAEQLNLKELSMGMSSDFEDAIINGSTYLRLGTVILGERHATN